ncbi:MAG: thiamine phosphate synthase [Gemmatimonadota bacterium]
MSGALPRWTRPRVEGLYGILDRAVAAAGASDPPGALARALGEALAGGCRVVQYRDKEASPAALLARARGLAGACRAAGAIFIVNDRLDVALLSEADGCHLGQDDLPLEEARRIAPPHFILGASTHDVVEARRAQALGADYIGVGAIFPTTSKADAAEPRGLRLVSEVAAAVAIPAIAISGVTRGNAREVLRAGASGFAVISDLFGGPGIRERAAEFARIWDEEKRRR